MTKVAGLDGPRTVICTSAGNLGQALAYSGNQRGIPTTVVAAITANPLKIERIRSLGATIKLIGDDIEAARIVARELAEQQNAYLLEDSLDIDSCEGAATIGLELVKDPTGFDFVLIALGAGAMATGIGYVFKSLSPQTQIIAIQPKGAPAMALSWQHHRIIKTDSIDTIADGVAGRFPIPEVLDDLLVTADDVALVEEDSIKMGMRLLYQKAGLIVEPSAALGIATILENPTRFAGKRIATIICGSNLRTQDFETWVLGQ